MRLPRAVFVEQFAIANDINCLRQSPRRGGPPLHLAPYLYERICTAAVGLARRLWEAAGHPLG